MHDTCDRGFGFAPWQDAGRGFGAKSNLRGLCGSQGYEAVRHNSLRGALAGFLLELFPNAKINIEVDVHTDCPRADVTMDLGDDNCFAFDVSFASIFKANGGWRTPR